ncbi:PREDICTED: uncharacterized protein LOC108756371 [Trachymyrmex septentrionalis]|uniref:uncharacterized protein LOC108756371 n=1 Tax=Trachymyrmex septentrionalis TaxID=34720 RepID=UPI00084EE11B|nr:PREDICTED: uncharacterized protein LOC108756371 [Trachymyrmex septentrionalis]
MEEARRRARAKALAGWRESLRDERLAGARTLDAIRPVFPAWIDRRHGQLSFHLTQILTGHGCFGAYLQRIGKERSARCHHCRRSVVDDAQHTLQDCEAWREERAELQEEVGQDLAPTALVREMVSGESAWRAVATFAIKVMIAKERAEREREREEEGNSPSSSRTARGGKRWWRR